VGIGSVIKAFSPGTKVYGVAASNSKSLAVSMAADHIVETEHRPTLAEAVAGGIDEDTITLPLARSVVDHVIECDKDEIAAVLRTLAFEENMIVEGSAALAFAGFKKIAPTLTGSTIVVVLCGANFDSDVMKQIICRP
jgi:threonine dehydratase